MKKVCKSNRAKIISPIAIICIAIGTISLAVYLLGREYSDFAEWIVNNVGAPIRQLLSRVTGIVKVSLAEIIIIISPFIVFLILRGAFVRHGFCQLTRYAISLMAVISLLWSGYVYTLGIGYFRTYAANRMGIEKIPVSEENLYTTALILQEECEALLSEIKFEDSGFSDPDISFDEMCREISVGYERLALDYPELGIEVFDSAAKKVVFSKALTYLEILGIYTFFTGESNVNVHYPDYTLPMTVAHEFAHQRGVARENEANFIAFMVCIRADNPYIRYSGYINMFEYVASALAKTNKPLLKSIYNNMDQRMYGEMKACTDFYYENRIELIGKISNFFNDNYLKSQGTEGVISYGMVVELCVSYYCNE